MFNEEAMAFPRKWLDIREFVRMDPATGEPQLLRVEPHFSENNEFIPDAVRIYIDNGPQMLMDRDDAEIFLLESGSVPLEITARWKHRKVN